MLGHKISTDITINTLMCVILASSVFYNLQIKSTRKNMLLITVKLKKHYKKAWLQNISC